MEQHQLLGDKGQDGNGINGGVVRELCVYAGSSWPLQKTKS
jgi:hypothetical protein